MNILMRTLLGAVLCLGLAAESHADLVYSNNFDATGGLAANDVGSGLAFQNSNYALEAADANFSSQYLSIGSQPDGNGNFTFGFWNASTAGATVNTVTTFEWDALYLDSDSDVYRTRLRGLNDNGTVTPNNDINLTGNVDVTQANSVAGTVENYVFVVNSTGAAVTLDPTLNGQGLTNSIPANSYALFQDGTIIDSDPNDLAGAANHLALWHQGDNPNNEQSFLYIDNFAVFSNVPSVVPEPSSIALLGLVGLAGAVRRKRR